MRRCLSAALVLFVLAGFVLADQVRGVITSVSKDEVKVSVKKKGEAPVEKTFKVTGSTKFCKSPGKGEKAESTADEVTSIVEKGAKGKAKGAFGVIETDGDTAKEICVVTGGKGKGKDKKKNP